jgi:hypothetical protein
VTGVIVAAFAQGAIVLGPMMGHISTTGKPAVALLLPAVLLSGVCVLSLGF